MSNHSRYYAAIVSQLLVDVLRNKHQPIAIGLELDYRVSFYQVHGMDRHRETQQDIRIEED
ncbi:MAG: hypothetical protein LW850_34075 [Planctomycetaceae bacterium]|nr:hypothetical protein [Planctomycetaceae bacterium]